MLNVLEGGGKRLVTVCISRPPTEFGSVFGKDSSNSRGDIFISDLAFALHAIRGYAGFKCRGEPTAQELCEIFGVEGET